MNENQEKLSKNRNMIFRLSLAIECYEDETNNHIPEIKELYKEIKEYREVKEKKGLEEELKITNNIIEKFEKLLEIIGADNFDIDEDGYVEYVGKGVELNG